MTKQISISVLSYYLQISTSALRQFIRRERLDHLLSGRQLAYLDVPQLLSVYTAKHGYQNRKWPIPEWIAAIHSRVDGSAQACCKGHRSGSNSNIHSGTSATRKAPPFWRDLKDLKTV